MFLPEEETAFPTEKYISSVQRLAKMGMGR